MLRDISPALEWLIMLIAQAIERDRSNDALIPLESNELTMESVRTLPRRQLRRPRKIDGYHDLR